MKKKLLTASSNEIIPEGYKALLETLKSRIHSSQAKAIINSPYAKNRTFGLSESPGEEVS